MELQSMKNIDSVKCPSQHVQLLSRKLALLVRKEVHWHGASFVLVFYSAPASCAIYSLIYLFIYLLYRKPHFFITHSLGCMVFSNRTDNGWLFISIIKMIEPNLL